MKQLEDESGLMQTYAEHGLRRRRRLPEVEGQSPRCPKCQQTLLVTIGKKGPAYHCGCKRVDG